MIRVSVVLASLLAFASTAGAVECQVEFDHSSRYDAGDLVFERDRQVVARIRADYSLEVDGRPVALGPEQQFAVAAYRGTYDGIVAEAREVGLAGAKLGGRAAMKVLGAVFTGGLDEVEAEIEAEAAELEVQAQSLCRLAESLRDQHRTLAVEIPEFGRALPL